MIGTAANRHCYQLDRSRFPGGPDLSNKFGVGREGCRIEYNGGLGERRHYLREQSHPFPDQFGIEKRKSERANSGSLSAWRGTIWLSLQHR
jgi:hypothetical protein